MALPAAPDPYALLTSATGEELATIDRCLPHTITGADRLLATIDATEYVVRAGIPGALAECGVYRGGSVLAMLLTLQRLGATDRDVYLYDTFEGMPEPTEADTSPYDEPALDHWKRARANGRLGWDHFFDPSLFTFDAVRDVILGSGYPAERIHFVVGLVEETIPAQAPERLAVLRLDTDWYESTRHELEHLYPRLVDGGVLIVDDYGHWDGSRRAVDEHFATAATPIHLVRTDYSGRVGIKR